MRKEEKAMQRLRGLKVGFASFVILYFFVEFGWNG